MKRIHHILLAICITVGIASGFAFSRMSGKIWTVKQDEVKIMFDLPKGDAKGTIGGLKAYIDFDPAATNLAVMKASVQVNTLTTGNNLRDKHLMSDDYFGVEKYPEISFTAESVVPGDNGYIATGKLAMRDSIRTVSIPFTFTGDEKTGVFKGSLEVFSGDYGVGKKSKSGSDKVKIDIEVPVMRAE